MRRRSFLRRVAGLIVSAPLAILLPRPERKIKVLSGYKAEMLAMLEATPPARYIGPGLMLSTKDLIPAWDRDDERLWC